MKWGIFYFLIVLSFLANGASVQADIQQLTSGRYQAGVQTEQFEKYAAPSTSGLQRRPNWCWAASIQMVLNYHGLPIEQEQVVERLYGGLVNKPVQQYQLLLALSGRYITHQGQSGKVVAKASNLDQTAIVKDLSRRWPLIAGIHSADGSGHIVVLTSAVFEMDDSGKSVIKSVVLRDPLPGNPSSQTLTWEEFSKSLRFLNHVYLEKTS